MKVKLNTSMSTDAGSFGVNEIVDLDSDHAKRMIDSGQADPVTSTKGRKPKNDDAQPDA